MPNHVLQEAHTGEDGVRVYVEDNFHWDDRTSKYKPQIVAIVNQITRENNKCEEIRPYTVDQSISRSKPGDPVFYVTCGSGMDAFNVWFKPTDAETGETFAATVPLERSAAVDACEQVSKSAATHPSTVQFSRFLDLAYVSHASGRARVVSTFTAKNAFNLELEYRIDCLFDGASLIETHIAESSG